MGTNNEGDSFDAGLGNLFPQHLRWIGEPLRPAGHVLVIPIGIHAAIRTPALLALQMSRHPRYRVLSTQLVDQGLNVQH